eukprot:CAMPEP_0196661432 /NCGR_PEP_ID=MMETSP1086-20130531/44279_1 /TAXON_ID=77921 /ORGANISM="Cyanoptyche  gloeocystis , Strain SAG4.97" /LENGTH=275 /DNA_ID=CAMNT_0041996325 /DNA_START=237 /DNA_END=1064 /DNA_ORIENTATION=+
MQFLPHTELAIVSSSETKSVTPIATSLRANQNCLDFILSNSLDALEDSSAASGQRSIADLGRSLLVICGPSGVGKSVLIQKLIEDFPHEFGFSVSHTTRDARPSERHGVDYHFISKEQMEAEIAAGKFLEYAEVHGNFYGTSTSAVADVVSSGRICILDLDAQGVKTMILKCPRALRIFVAPPSIDTLERRLRQRGTEAEDVIRRRMRNALRELHFSNIPGNFHHHIVNDDLEDAYSRLRAAVEPLRDARERDAAVRQHLDERTDDFFPQLAFAS